MRQEIDQDFRELPEEEITQLSEEEVEKIERVNNAIARRDKARRWRITFEKASEEAVPFIIYVVYNSYLALVVLFRLLEYEGQKFIVGAIILSLIVVAPLFILQRQTFRDFYSWVLNRLGFGSRGEPEPNQPGNR